MPLCHMQGVSSHCPHAPEQCPPRSDEHAVSKGQRPVSHLPPVARGQEAFSSVSGKFVIKVFFKSNFVFKFINVIREWCQ